MPWRKNWFQKKEPEPEDPPDLFHVVKGEVRPFRAQGDPPERDRTRFSGFICDLCNTTHPVQELRQCVLCGRYACGSCWTPEYYVCNSCNGIIRLTSIRREE
jgi:hypothetical protein